MRTERSVVVQGDADVIFVTPLDLDDRRASLKSAAIISAFDTKAGELDACGIGSLTETGNDLLDIS